MSIQWMTRVLAAGPELPAGAKRCALITIANHANDEGWCHIKRSTLERESGLAEGTRTTDRTVVWLEAEGYIERDVNAWSGVNGQIPEGKRPNVWWIRIDSNGQPTGPRVRREAGSGRPRQSDGGGDRQSDGGGDRQSDGAEPSLEPSVEETPSSPGDGQLTLDDSHPSPPAVAKQTQWERFLVWWGEGRHSGLYPEKRGSRSVAFRKWKIAVAAAGEHTVNRCTLNYANTREAFHADHGVEAPLMHGCTFLEKARFLDWDEPWDKEKRDIEWAPALRRSNRPARAIRTEAELDALVAQVDGA